MGLDWFEITMIVMVSGCFIVLGCGMYDSTNYTSLDVLIGDTGIRSLNDGSRIHGSFSLGSGYIDQYPQFIFYQIEGNGYVLRTVKADYAKIIEGENDKPFIRQYDHYRIGHITGMKAKCESTYEFHVPNGTIIKDWILDSEL